VRDESGQGTVEWVGLVLLVTLGLVAALAVAGARFPGTDVARMIAERIVCAVRLSDSCRTEPELVAAYGPELAAEVRAHAPGIVYENGMTALPVDYRTCRSAGCGNAPPWGAVWRSDTGEPAAAFVHVLDCRLWAPPPPGGVDCSGERSGHVYVQYWLYYEDSTSLRDLPGEIGHHGDDWESYQVRLGPDGAESRASSHHGYNYDGGPGSWVSDTGVARRSAWGPSTGRMYVSGGSHAGHVHEPRPLVRVRRGPRTRFIRRLPGDLGERDRPTRWTPAGRLALIPIETLSLSDRSQSFAVVPPWLKPIYLDPESEET
jgi:hypothetical protein